MKTGNIVLGAMIGIGLAVCAPAYTLVSPGAVAVSKGTMVVQPTAAWNKVPGAWNDVPRQENWTRNGPLLDTITFIGALAPGEAIAKQKAKDDRQVPPFRADMTPQDLVSMVETYYRVRAGAAVFETTHVQPVVFLGQPAVQVDFSYIVADEVERLGRSKLAIIDGKLYGMSLDGTALHYFGAALPEFEAMSASAIRR